ncbi:MAG: hypothetical protein R3B93_06110 [Bacteroidia bacterium]
MNWGKVTHLEYQWGFSLVALWSSHLDPADGVMWIFLLAPLEILISQPLPEDD